MADLKTLERIRVRFTRLPKDKRGRVEQTLKRLDTRIEAAKQAEAAAAVTAVKGK